MTCTRLNWIWNAWEIPYEWHEIIRILFNLVVFLLCLLKESHAIIVIKFWVKIYLWSFDCLLFLFYFECFVIKYTPKISLSHFNRKHVCSMFSVTFIVRERTGSLCTYLHVYQVLFRIQFTWSKNHHQHQRERTMRQRKRKVQAVASFTCLYFHIVNTDNH